MPWTFVSISKNGQIVGHLFGSAHGSVPEFVGLPDHILLAINSSKTIAMEGLASRDALLDGMKVMSSSTMTMKMSDIYQDEDISELETKIKSELSRTIPKRNIQRAHPQTIVDLFMAKCGRLVPPGISLDAVILGYAQAYGKDISVLETGAAQMEYVRNVGADEWKKSIKAVVSYASSSKCESSGKAHFDELIRTLKTGEFDKLYKNDLVYFGETAGIGALTKMSIFDRNQSLAQKISDLVSGGKTPFFAALGASHLGGDQGVIALLRKQGFQVTLVTLKKD
jgi:uncharacterized protein